MDPLISVDDLAVRLGDPRLVVLDVRWRLDAPDGRPAFREAHVPGAVFVDLETELAAPPSAAEGRHPLPDSAGLQAAARRWGIGDGDLVVAYDDLGGMSAARAWWLLADAGVDVRLLDGGLAAWRAAGRPVESGDRMPRPGAVVLTPGRLPVVDRVALEPFDGVLLDARAGERYRGDAEPIDPLAGHIPGAVSAPAAGNLGPDGRFLAPDALRRRFEALGVRAGAPVATYCGSGVTAAHEVVALVRAGFTPALYPGSWSQWSNRPGAPVATGPDPR
ncbi:sulfurtransferase [Amnibacterium sp.]|uniref:sulfurtransferase n=1 Tax=Amnibacterium sp. TaxID=1872496 RepID=UPI002609F62F|nr:sulfurtransferase [Amnibacterium sp.]MCU1473637.1 rhodanese-related sulfurtransferase [Amnibacterium sp.]